jgi:hypothetical protein
LITKNSGLLTVRINFAFHKIYVRSYQGEFSVNAAEFKKYWACVNQMGFNETEIKTATHWRNI